MSSLATQTDTMMSGNGMPDSDMTGPVKAALWILSVDEHVAAEVIATLDEAELQALHAAVRQIERASSEQLIAVHSELASSLERPGLRLLGRAPYLRQLAEKNLAPEVVSNVFGRADAQDAKPQPTLADADPEALATLLSQEHPQVVAAVVARLDAKRASEVLKHLPPNALKSVISRLARITTIAAPALEEAERLLASELPARDARDATVDGARVAALLLNQLGTEDAESILNAMGEETPEVAASVRRAMFTFDDLSRLDKRGVQMLLKNVDNQQLLVALKTASEDLRAKIFEALSKRAAEMMRDDLEMLGPQRVADVEAAQQAIVATAMTLRGEGKLNVDMGDGEAMA